MFHTSKFYVVFVRNRLTMLLGRLRAVIIPVIIYFISRQFFVEIILEKNYVWNT